MVVGVQLSVCNCRPTGIFNSLQPVLGVVMGSIGRLVGYQGKNQQRLKDSASTSKVCNRSHHRDAVSWRQHGECVVISIRFTLSI